MKVDDIKLVCIHDKDSDTWTVYPENLTGLIVQVDKLEDAPKELAKSFEAMIKYGFDENIHEKYESSLNGTENWKKNF